MKIVIFWDVAPCSFVDTNVSEDHIASIIRAVGKPSENVGVDEGVGLTRESSLRTDGREGFGPGCW
jgi:hypothetical protein